MTNTTGVGTCDDVPAPLTFFLTPPFLHRFRARGHQRFDDVRKLRDRIRPAPGNLQREQFDLGKIPFTPDGGIANGKVLFDAAASTKTKKGVPDGLKVDREGNLFAAGPGGIYVIAADGTHLGSIETSVPTGNVAWGETGSSLFITSSTNVYRLKLTTKGAGF